MKFGYSDEEKAIKRSVRDLLRDKYPIGKTIDFLEGQELSGDLHKELIQLGIIGILTRGEKGMEGLMPILAVFEEAGRALLPYPLLENVLAAYTLSLDDSKSSYFDEISMGKKKATIAWEKNGTPYAIKDGGEYLAYGSFYGVPFAESSEYILGSFQLKGTNTTPSQEQTLVLLDRNNPNVTVKKMKSMDQTYPLYAVEVTNYSFQDKDIILNIGSGTSLMQELKELGALLSSAEMLGMSDEILYKTVEYTKERKQFDQPIAKFQAMKHMAADMYVMLESSRVAVMYAGWACEEGVEKESISIAKAYTSEATIKMTGMALQMHGGIGFTWESDIHLFFKRARRAGSQFGDTYEHRELIMKKLVEEVV